MPPRRSVFALPDRLRAKADPHLIGADEAHLSAIADSVADQLAVARDRLAELRRIPAASGRESLERDLQIHRLNSRICVLERFTEDACLGRMIPADGGDPVYIGRVGLTDGAGRQLLVDWRTPAAEPFFAATHARPLGLASRRRYRWTDRRVTDYWDEVFSEEGLTESAVLDSQSAFRASLGAARTSRMRDVLGTLAADQDAVIRASSEGVLVVDGGPGTGKTVVALHRAAYLSYADPRLNGQHGGMLFVGPHEAYLAYVSDVLPSLGEEGVRTATIQDLVPGVTIAGEENEPETARLKATARMIDAIEPAVAMYEEPPAEELVVPTRWGDAVLGAQEWAEAFDAVDEQTPHNEAIEQIVAAAVEILSDSFPGAPPEELRAALERNPVLRRGIRRAWPILDPADVAADLWAVPAYLAHCAPWLSADERRILRRPEGSPWTRADLPILDALRARLGDPATQARTRRRQQEEADDRSYMDDVVREILAADDNPESGLTMLNRASVRESLVHEEAMTPESTDPLRGPYAHVIVDEAQELTEAEWLMLLRRCPSRSITVVGDRAQARQGFRESWAERLARVGLGDVRVSTLSINYRTPAEVMAEAEPVIVAALPDAAVPTSIRSTGRPVRYEPITQRDAILREWLAQHETGVACVIGDPSFEAMDRIASLSPVDAKGLEFDLVVLRDDVAFGRGITGAVDRYVAMTRATQDLVILR